MSETNLLAICENCGNFSLVNNFLTVKNTKNVFLNVKNSYVGACMNCGYPRRRIIDGTYSFVDDLIRTISLDNYSREELEKIYSSLMRVKNNTLTFEEFDQEMEDSKLSFFSLKSLFPQDRKEQRENTLFVINLIFTIVSLLLSIASFQGSDRKEVSYEEVMEYFVENQEELLSSEFEEGEEDETND